MGPSILIVVGFIRRVVDVSCTENFRHLMAGKQIDQRMPCSAGAVRRRGIFVNPILPVHTAADRRLRYRRP